MREKGWSRRFEDPIRPPKGKPLLTLRDAARYMLALPANERRGPGVASQSRSAADGRGRKRPADACAHRHVEGTQPRPAGSPAITVTNSFSYVALFW